MPISGVYRIINTVNEKCYIGSSGDIKRRWRDHKTRLRRGKHCNQHLQRAWNKYGEENFKFEIIEAIPTEKHRIDAEQFYIDYYSPEYNIDPKAGRGLGFAKETLEKFSKNRSGKGNPMYGKTGEEHPRYGGTHTKKAREQISKAQSGKGNSMYGKAGDDCPNSKLSSKKVRQIKRMLAETNKTQIEIGERFGVDNSTISDIKNNRTWTHIKIP